MAKIIVKITKYTEMYEDYRSGGEVTCYKKDYICGKCKHSVAKNAKFCSNCGESLEKVEDYYLSDAKKKMAVLKTKRTKLLKTVNGDNFRCVSKEVDELDRKIENYRGAINEWKRFEDGSCPDILRI